MFRTSALVGVLLCGSLAQAADYWVRNGGSDAADGLSVGTAWNTLVHAAAVVGPGDTVHVQDGNYQGFYLSTSGTSGAPITFRAEGANVRITSNNPSTPDGINLEGASWVVIDGFIVNDRSRTGVRAVEASHVTIRNCHLGNNFKWGILTGFVDDLLIENNEAHHSQDEHGIYVGNSCNRPVVRNNVVHHNAGCGMHFNGDIFTCCGDGLIEDAVIEGNIAYENGAPHGGSAINMDGGVRAVIRNNLLYDNHASGISLYQIDGGAPATNNQIINNTIIQASDGRWAINISDGSTGNTVRNNILWNAHSFRGVISLDAASRPGFVSDYNSLMNRMSIDGGDTSMSLSAWQALGYDLHSFLAVPADHFVAPGTDFHLLASSPAIDTGVLTGAPSSDLDGAPRPVGAAIDLGAYERQLLTCGNGSPDVGEQCGEPGIGPCSDPCTACVSCTCATVAPHVRRQLDLRRRSLRAGRRLRRRVQLRWLRLRRPTDVHERHHARQAAPDTGRFADEDRTQSGSDHSVAVVRDRAARQRDSHRRRRRERARRSRCHAPRRRPLEEQCKWHHLDLCGFDRRGRRHHPRRDPKSIQQNAGLVAGRGAWARWVAGGVAEPLQHACDTDRGHGERVRIVSVERPQRRQAALHRADGTVAVQVSPASLA